MEHNAAAALRTAVEPVQGGWFRSVPLGWGGRGETRACRGRPVRCRALGGWGRGRSEGEHRVRGVRRSGTKKTDPGDLRTLLLGETGKGRRERARPKRNKQ